MRELIRRPWLLFFAIMLNVVLSIFTVRASASDVVVQDQWGRTINSVGVTLIDWEGQLANPAFALTLAPPNSASYPLTITLTADDVRLYFDLYSTTSNTGPTKIVSFPDATPQTIYMGIFPDRADGDEAYTLTLELDESSVITTTTIPIQVLDFDQPSRLLDFDIMIDYRHDAIGNRFFVDNSTAQATAQLAADDWAYFIGDMNLDVVPVNDEFTWGWDHPNGFHSGTGQWYLNNTSYTGYRLYIYGIDCIIDTDCFSDGTNVRSGGISANDLNRIQRSGGTPLVPNLYRSGLIDFEVKGDYDINGWAFPTGDDDWQSNPTAGGGVNDAYSVIHHEIGHALVFNDLFPAFTKNSSITSPAIVAYYGGSVSIDGFDHFNGVIDPASQYGIFGNEYNGTMPSRRWLPTKLDLLLMEAVGYDIRSLSALEDLALLTTSLPSAQIGRTYTGQLVAESNTPYFLYGLSGQSVPADGIFDLGNGLTLNSFTGEIIGIPLAATDFSLTFEVCDASTYSNPCITRQLAIQVTGNTVDTNNDGIVSPVDALFVINRLGNPPTGNDIPADINNDGGINLSDVTLVMNELGNTP